MTLLDMGAPAAPVDLEHLPSPSAPRPRQRVGGILRSHPAWIVVLGACAVLARTALQAGLNTDVFWHLAAGQWMLQHHSVVRHDTWSYTINGHSWFAEEWGFEVLLAWMVAHLGAVSYWILAAGPCCAALVLSVFRWRRQGAQPIWTGVLAIVAAVCLDAGVAPRPQVLSYGLFALELLILTKARTNSRWLWSMPAVTLFWANVHGSFLAGLGLLLLDVVLSTRLAASLFSASMGRRLVISRPLPLRTAAPAVAASILAACVNPHGPALYSYALKVTTSSRLAGYIDEWKSPDFHSSIVMVGIALPTIAAVVILASGRRRIELFDFAVWVVLLLATLRANRFMPYLGIALGGLLASYHPIRRESVRPSWLTPLLSAVLCLSLLSGNHPSAGTPESRGYLANPVRAAAWLSHQPGRVFSTYVWNDYLIHARIPVFVDGRTDMYFGTDVLPEYVQVSGLTVAPDPVLDEYHVRWVLWPKGQPLSLYLAKDPNWRLARTFGSQLVFERILPSTSTR